MKGGTSIGGKTRIRTWYFASRVERVGKKTKYKREYVQFVVKYFNLFIMWYNLR